LQSVESVAVDLGILRGRHGAPAIWVLVCSSAGCFALNGPAERTSTRPCKGHTALRQEFERFSRVELRGK
jgi:hypothetical protein